MRALLVTSIIASLVAVPLFSQEEPRVEESDEDSLQVSRDSLEVPVDSDTAILPSGEIDKEKSVGTAMLLSAVLPGGGQFYNHRYHKGGWIAAAELVLGALTVREHLLMTDVEESWSGTFPDSVRADEWEYHRARRNMFAFFTGAAIAYAVADAYVDAHMFGFREAQRLTLVPSFRGLGLMLTCRF